MHFNFDPSINDRLSARHADRAAELSKAEKLREAEAQKIHYNNLINRAHSLGLFTTRWWRRDRLVEHDHETMRASKIGNLALEHDLAGTLQGRILYKPKTRIDDFKKADDETTIIQFRFLEEDYDAPIDFFDVAAVRGPWIKFDDVLGHTYSQMTYLPNLNVGSDKLEQVSELLSLMESADLTQRESDYN